MTSTSSSTASSEVPADRRLLDLHDAILSPAVQVVSTDVFDTLVWRQVPEPVDAFPLVAQRLRARGALSESLTPLAFGQLRRLAERSARNDRQRELQQSEVRLDEIYDRIPPWVFDFTRREEAVEAELEVESELLVPDLDIVAILAAAQEAGKRVVAISDIYFSASQLRRLLSQPVLGEVHFDHLFTSSDHRTNKSGGLFEIALRALDVAGSQVAHVGDNHEADVVYPSRLGIRSFYFERRPEELTAVTEREARFMPSASSTPEQASLVSGLTATRTKVLSRTAAQEIPGGLRPFWGYGATVLGPLFTGFAEWVQEHCERRGTRRVGGLMREGAFLGELLRRSNAYVGGELEPLPLWVNRDICLRASLVEGSEEELLRLLARRSVPTVGGLCRTLGVQISSLPQWTTHGDTSLEDPVVRASFISTLSSTDRVRTKMVEGSRVLRERIVTHVGRVCDGDGPLTLVDLGWGASIQGLLAGLLHQAGAPRGIVGLYMVTHEGAAEQVVNGIEAHGFLGEYGWPDDTVKLVMRSPELLEQICMPPHGTQLDLDEDLQPTLAPANLPRLQLVEAETVRKGVLSYQREWARYKTALADKIAPLSRARHLLRPILLRSVVVPTPEEVARFGHWRHDEGQGSGETEAIADPGAVERLRHMSPEQAKDLPMAELYWPFGLAALVDEHWPDLMTAAAAGDVSWDALAAPLETGSFRIAGAGVDVDPDSVVAVRPSRNRLGLSSVRGTVRAPHLQEVVLAISELPAVLRIDWIELRCHVQGRGEPLTVRFDDGPALRRWRHANCFVLNPDVFIAHSAGATLSLSLAEVVRGIVFRVDVECAFAALAIGPVLPAGGRFANLEEAEQAVARTEKQLSELQGSASWKATAPLRAAKRRLS